MYRAARVHQLKRHIELYGAEGASWFVSWREPDGKQKTQSFGSGSKGKLAAQKKSEKIRAELMTETYQVQKRQTWQQFRDAYNAKILEPMELSSREVVRHSLDAFERLGKPKKVSSITSETISDFIAKRRNEDGAAIRTGTDADGKPVFERRKISPATINKDLRNIKSCLRIANQWGDLKIVPRISFLKEYSKLATYVTPEHFEAIYTACETANFPDDIPNVTPTDWWRGLITLAMMTGWRIGQILELKWKDINLEAGTAVSQAESNKGGRDVKIPLHPVVLDHLRILAGGFAPNVFPWNRSRVLIWRQFSRIQDKAKLADGSPLPRGGKRDRQYGFHDLRRGFATMNAGHIDLFKLQTLMQHTSLETTRGYVNMAKSLSESVASLHVPAVLTNRPNRIAN